MSETEWVEMQVCRQSTASMKVDSKTVLFNTLDCFQEDLGAGNIEAESLSDAANTCDIAISRRVPCQGTFSSAQ